MFLLDTNVVSEAIKPSPDAKVMGWLESHVGTDAYLSVLTCSSQMNTKSISKAVQVSYQSLQLSFYTFSRGDIITASL